MTRELACVKLYIDREAFEADAGEPLTDTMLEWMGALVNDEIAAFYCGYSGWEVGWVNTCPCP